MKAYTKYWKEAANKKQITCRDVVLHCALKAFFAKGENKKEIFKALISKSFTPVTNKVKLANGAKPWYCVETSLRQIVWMLSFRDTSNANFQVFGINMAFFFEQVFGQDKELFKEFRSFLRDNVTEKFSKRYYTYIFVDQEKVEPIYQAVQAAHVAMVIGQRMSKDMNASNIHFQICKKPEDIDIQGLAGSLSQKGFRVETFYEEDVDRVIAIGTHPIPDHKRSSLTKNNLLTF